MLRQINRHFLIPLPKPSTWRHNFRMMINLGKTAARWTRSMLAPRIYDSAFAIIPGRMQATWRQRMFLKRFLVDLDIDCVLDVGANVGQYGSELRRIGYGGQIFSFEPDPATFRRLEERSAHDKDWHAINLALGSIAGRADFNLMAVPLFNSFRLPSTHETDSFMGCNEVIQTCEIEVARLSDILPKLRQQYGFARVFLKMDTQGFDTEVFAGAGEVRNDILGFQSEVGIKRLYEDVAPWAEQITLYQDAGFVLAGMFPVNPGEPEVMEVDCYFRSKGASPRPQ